MDSNVDRKILAQIQLAKAPGPDGIHPYVLKMCAANLCKSLQLLFLLVLYWYTIPK